MDHSRSRLRKIGFGAIAIDNELQNTDTHTVCYFFRKDNEVQDNIANALCALLHQLFARHPQLLQHAAPAWEKGGDKLATEVDELWRILLAAATDLDCHNVTCVLDGLDECRKEDRHEIIQRLTWFYSAASLLDAQKSRLKFLITSRPYGDIESGFKSIPSSLPMNRLLGELENDQIRDGNRHRHSAQSKAVGRGRGHRSEYLGYSDEPAPWDGESHLSLAVSCHGKCLRNL